jgi:hypothetical protein
VKSSLGDDLKSSLDEDVSEKPMTGMLDPFSTDTLTFIRTIETFVVSAFTTILRTTRISGSFLFFW